MCGIISSEISCERARLNSPMFPLTRTLPTSSRRPYRATSFNQRGQRLACVPLEGGYWKFKRSTNLILLYNSHAHGAILLSTDYRLSSKSNLYFTSLQLCPDVRRL